jgi:hypothetical protein
MSRITMKSQNHSHSQTQNQRSGNPGVGTEPPASDPKRAPSRDDIAKRAYEIYVARGSARGQELEDWLQAERELMLKSPPPLTRF